MEEARDVNTNDLDDFTFQLFADAVAARCSDICIE